MLVDEHHDTVVRMAVDLSSARTEVLHMLAAAADCKPVAIVECIAMKCQNILVRLSLLES